jgi:hypothetical protein
MEEFHDLLNEKKAKVREQECVLATTSVDPEELATSQAIGLMREVSSSRFVASFSNLWTLAFCSVDFWLHSSKACTEAAHHPTTRAKKKRRLILRGASRASKRKTTAAPVNESDDDAFEAMDMDKVKRGSPSDSENGGQTTVP